MSAEQAISIPSTPGDATPSLRSQSILDGLSLCTITDIYLRLGEMQATVKEVKETNTGLQQRLSESNKQQEQLISELRDAKQQVAQLTLKLAESEKANAQLKTDVQQVTNQVSEAKVNSDREQEQARATAQTLKQQIAQVTARAAQSERTATEIAAKAQGFFAKTERNDERLNKLQQAFTSISTLDVATKQEVSGVKIKGGFYPANSQRCQSMLGLKNSSNPADRFAAALCGELIYEAKPVYLSSEEQAAFKAMGEALSVDQPSAASVAKR